MTEPVAERLSTIVEMINEADDGEEEEEDDDKDIPEKKRYSGGKSKKARADAIRQKEMHVDRGT